MTQFEELLARLARMLELEKIPYMVIGGQAVLIYGEPRMTVDVDVTLGLNVDSVGRVIQLLGKNGMKPLARDSVNFARQTHVLPVQNSHSTQRVDFIFSETPYEEQAIRRSVPKPVGGVAVRFISPEDLLIHKLVAGRPRDLEDARNVWLRNAGALDSKYIKACLKQFVAVDGLSDILDRWAQIRIVS